MSFSKWFKSLFEKNDEVFYKSCMELLDDVLDPVIDKQISSEEEAQFKDHIEKCMPCYERYNLDKTIKEMIKSNCKHQEVPNDLRDAIRLKIAEAGK